MTNIIEVPVKVEFLGKFTDFESWLKHVQSCANKFGVNSKLLHIDSNGFSTTGYDLRNTKSNSAFPVTTYLLVQDPNIERPLPFKSIANN